MRLFNTKVNASPSAPPLTSTKWEVVQVLADLSARSLLPLISKTESAPAWATTKLPNTTVKWSRPVPTILQNILTDVTVKLLESSLTKRFPTPVLTVVIYLFSACPSTTFAHQGLCVNCPNNCLTCGIDFFHRMFLECKVCQPGYKLNDGQCFKECNSNLGFTMAANGTCLKCIDGNCVNCPNDPAICMKCNILYTLSNGTCLRKLFN